MAKKRKESTQRTDKGLEIPVPTRKAWDDVLGKVIKPARDGRQDSDEAAEPGREEPDD